MKRQFPMTKRILSLAVIISFIATNHFGPIAFAMPGGRQAAGNTSLDIEKGTGNHSLPVPFSLQNISQVRVPSEIGKIQELSKGKGSKVVILIQDAHAIPDAQKNIQRLIDHFQKEYGVGLVALEGAAAKLDSQIFKSFPDKETLKKVFQGYRERGELAGGVAAAIFSTPHPNPLPQGGRGGSEPLRRNGHRSGRPGGASCPTDSRPRHPRTARWTILGHRSDAPMNRPFFRWLTRLASRRDDLPGLLHCFNARR